ncbi:cytochrome c oxidase assembly protein [Alkalihalobacillus sp. AL-G]|uniref:cytochrome c oxidase assembly protein n=1 Tax=Alkalihalobacillus sp. AL-G TaxID=2926399 RepID=UPI00272AAC33|nr:cytochrome c oxidase assembly protein [Alkalihalobacillus sp. AL-G]WLD94050.1 cytochrome c oxidase assembly protein [Alkalihalobacillus sp. AL-G]
MIYNQMHPSRSILFELILLLPFIVILLSYIVAAVLSSHCHTRWPLYRTVFWALGVLCAASTIVGPIANHALMDFGVHMLGHLLLGMLAPLLMALAAPMTLIMRTLDVGSARCLSRVLRSRPVSILSNPIITSFVNIGGLWVLYSTDLYMAMTHNILLHLIVHIHVFVAGYLFTISLIYIDPTPHRLSFVYRAIVLLISLAAHSILSKYIYAHPPAGVPISQAEEGGMLMYYGGDAIEVVVISILCFQWFKATRPKEPLAINP